MPPRFKIRDLAALTFFSALVFTSLRGPLRESADPSIVLAPLACTVVLGTLMLALVIARFGTQRRRVFAWGFAVFGFSYFLSFVHGSLTAHRFDEGFAPLWNIATMGADRLYELSSGRPLCSSTFMDFIG